MLQCPPKSSNSIKPDYIVDTVQDVDFTYLKKQGIKAVMIDLDGTVVSHGTFHVEQELIDYLKKQSIKIFIATNRSKSKDLKHLRISLNASGVVHPAGMFIKPFPKYFKHMATQYGYEPTEIAMIGNRLFQDILGGNLAGLTTILVYKLGEHSGFFDYHLSELERKYTDKIALKYKPVP
jgi:HAD superfamily phosphatase (TIGR01668 family)